VQEGGGYLKAAFEYSLIVLAILGILSVFACGGDEEAEHSAMSLSDDISDSLTIILGGRDSVSVLSLLEEDHRVETKASAIGLFVTCIDSLENSMYAYWLYSVNDTMPQVSCDKMITRIGDRVVWHYRKID
jgi:hypothetical protein